MEAVIARCQVCHLALASPDGRPYVVPLHFGYAPGPPPVLYFHSARHGRKLDLLRQNPRCAFVIDRDLGLVTRPRACDWSTGYESVMGAGRIEIVTHPEERRAGLDRLMAQYGNHSPSYSPEELARTVVLRLTVEEMSGKRKAGAGEP